MTSAKRALLFGNSFSAAPILFALKKYGLHVSVCGNVEADPCHQYADDSYYVDYSKPEELMGVVESGRYDSLVPNCNDMFGIEESLERLRFLDVIARSSHSRKWEKML